MSLLFEFVGGKDLQIEAFDAYNKAMKLNAGKNKFLDFEIYKSQGEKSRA
jgi:hypothetical protein